MSSHQAPQLSGSFPLAVVLPITEERFVHIAQEARANETYEIP